MFVITCIITSMARNSLLCADVPLRNYSLTQLCTSNMPEVIGAVSLIVECLYVNTLWNSLPLSVRDPSLTMMQFCNLQTSGDFSVLPSILYLA